VLTNDTLGADAITTVINTGDAKYGTLVDNGDGTWSYQLNNSLQAVQALNDGQTLTETIRYTITDADGDITTAELTITINGQTDGPPVVTPEDADGNVSAAHNSVVEGTGDTVTGSVSVSAEAGIAGVTVGGKDVTGASAANPVVITTTKGILSVTGYDATGKITYPTRKPAAPTTTRQATTASRTTSPSPSPTWPASPPATTWSSRSSTRRPWPRTTPLPSRKMPPLRSPAAC
jgi:VCBS repeat-containing protein